LGLLIVLQTATAQTRLQRTQDEVLVAAHPTPTTEAPAPFPQVVPSIAIRQATLDITNSKKVGESELSLVNAQSNPADTAVSETTPTSLTPQHSRRNSGESSSSNLSRTDSGQSKIVHELKNQLEENRLECPLRPHSFVVPKDVQEKLITVSTITKDILAHNTHISEQEAKEYAEQACQHARSLYATLAYIKRGADICALLKEGITDKILPLIRKPNDKKAILYYRQSGDVVRVMENWRPKYRENFDRVQWWMTAPVFKEGKHCSLDEKTVLPFMPLDPYDATLGKKQGGYSEVYPVRIHPAHHNFWKSSGEVQKPYIQTSWIIRLI
jgi:hypothetical protein